jgi:hypothetical protein
MATIPVQTQINTLAARMAVIDGQGLTNPATSFITITDASIAGLKTDLRQAVLSLETSINQMMTALNSLTQMIQTYMGVPPGTPPVNYTVPPAG